MKKQILIYDKKILHYIFVLSLKDGGVIKEVNAFVRKSDKTFVIDLLRGFKGSWIDYSHFKEKVYYEAKMHLKTEINSAETGYKQTRINFTNDMKTFLKMLQNEHSEEFERVRWNELKRKRNR